MTVKSSKDLRARFRKAKKIQVGEWIYDLNKLTISQGGDELSLEPKIVDLLSYLIKNPNRVISKQELMDNVWQTIVSDNTVSRGIVRLRRTLNDDPQNPAYVVTVPRKGYRLIAPVQPLDRSTANPPSKQWSIAAGIALLLVIIILGSAYRLNAPEPNASNSPMKLTPITTLIGDEINPALSSDGRLLAFAHRESADRPFRIMVKDLHNNLTYGVTTGAKNAWLPAWSPDNTKLVYQNHYSSEYCQINIADVSNLSKPVINESVLDCNRGVGSGSVIWGGPDVLYYAEAASENDPFIIYRYHISSKNLNQITSPPNSGRGDYRMQLSPDGKWLAFVRNPVYWTQSELWLHSIETGETRRIIKLPLRLRALAWLPDSKHLVVANPNKQLQSVNIDTGTTVELTSEVLSLFHPSASGGKLVASAGSFHHREIWHADGAFDSESPEAITPSPFIVSTKSDYLPRLNPHISSVAFISERSGLPQIWLKDEIGQLHQLTEFDQAYHFQSLSWSPDGLKLTAAANDQLIWLDITNRQVNFGPEDLMTVAKPVWDWDNQRIYFSHKVGLEWQLFSYSTISGETTQITQSGGYRSTPSRSEDALFLSKIPQSGFWKLNLNSGTEMPISDWLKTQNFNRDWVVDSAEQYFFFVDPKNISTLQRLAIDGGSELPVDVLRLNRDTIVDFDISQDHKTLLYTRTVLGESDIVLLTPVD